MDPVVSFNIPARDMKKASEFYRQVFGWAIDPIQGSGGEYHRAGTLDVNEDGVPISPGAINGGLFRKGTHGIEGTFLEVQVDSIDESMVKVLENGGSIILEKRPMMDFANFAIIQDLDGNRIGLMEYRKR